MTLNELKQCIQKKYLHRGDYTLSSGKKSDKYFDIKSMMGQWQDSILLTDEIDKFIVHEGLDEYAKSMGGTELGGALIVAAMIRFSMISNVCYIRKGERTHGLKKMIEGNPISPILLVDDVISTGKTVIDSIITCNKKDYSVMGVLCVIDRWGQKQISSVPTYSLFKEQDFV